MAYVQNQFEAFHEAIKLKRFEENETLIEKREAVLKKLRSELPPVFAAAGKPYSAPVIRNQGSYEMGTGVKPLNGDYDIDQGVYFSLSSTDYPDPVVLKEYVYKALDGHTKEVRIRQSCVTVFYQRSGEHLYHVDLAIYVDGSKDSNNKSKLAKGKQNSKAENRFWENSDPALLSKTIFARFGTNERRQFRHVIRYMKRWRDQNYRSESGNAVPTGIALTLAAHKWFTPNIVDPMTGKSDDLESLRGLVASMLDSFNYVWHSPSGKSMRRLVINLPIDPYHDVLVRMSEIQMEILELRLKTLKTALDEAYTKVDPVDACIALRRVFGDDFIVPPKRDTARTHEPAMASSGNSA